MIDYSKAKKVLQVEHLKQYFNIGKPDEVRAVDDITFDVYQGETFGLVGESGSGKTTTGRAIIHLYEPTSGKIIFNGEDVSKLRTKAQKQKFRRDMQMIFQDPYASLNPRMKVKDIVAEGIDINHLAKNDADRTKQVEDLLETVGLNRDHSSRYPHEFSGGQRQRIGIARALAVQPEFIIADEPISALDVSIQAK
ncbi:oligopeptide transport ATP-binding protein OppF [Lentilactobacillus farraginis DSM 18382 = JCM 14108]|uniref:Oligopeptide transport ATP-binding protein OppF n=1 Tax=Lentilactobacillus farraginis DSM 18382 = JCM 14108 TaxID=1423743 RepID=X0PJ94_9LACO|nr:oligopeptide transport ATP-binding protein OppF [Lentilactobacillus farraginis DSM 18382 = JCM 14108]